MPAKTWKLAVTELGANTPPSEVSVEGSNWMAALTAGRKKLGEQGGVPSGASCAVAPDGKVTVHDPLGHRSYVLIPGGLPGAETGESKESKESKHKRGKRAKSKKGSKTGKPGKTTKATKVSAPDASTEASRPSSRRSAKRTMDYDLTTQPVPAPDKPKQPRAFKKTMVYGGPAPAAPGAPATTAEAPPEAAPATTAASEPAPAPGWELIHERDAEPREDSPLCYRERAFLMPAGTSDEQAGEYLRAQCTACQESVAALGEGKFFNFAAFDHRWQGRPTEAPLAVLTWKDWRGDPEVAFPHRAAQASSRPPAKGRTATDEHDVRLAQAFEASQDLFFLSTPAEGLDFVVDLLDKLVPTEASSACLYDINTDEFRFVAVRGPGADERKSEAVPSKMGLLGEAAQRVGAATVTDDVGSAPDFDPGIDGRVGVDPENFLYMPLHHQGRLLGMLQLINRQTAQGFTPGDADVTAYVAKQAGEFLYKARVAPDETPARSQG